MPCRINLPCLLAILTFFTQPAIGDDSGTCESISPSSSARLCREAEALNRKGNMLFRRRHHTEALATYELALARWDHPRVRLHIAMVLMRLDSQPLEAYRHIKKALSSNSMMLSPQEKEHAREMGILLRGELGVLRVLTSQSEVQITVDNEFMIGGSGMISQLVAPGIHRVQASGLGLQPAAGYVEIIPGGDARVTVELTREDEPNPPRSSIWFWGPLVVGSGLAFFSGGLYWSANSKIRSACQSSCDSGDLSIVSSSGIEHGVKQQWLATAGLVVSGVLIAFSVRLRKATKRKNPMQITLGRTIGIGGEF